MKRNRKTYGKTYERTKRRYLGLPCTDVLLKIFKATRTAWTYDELRWMTGYSVFTIAQAIGKLKRERYAVEKSWCVEARTHLYFVS